MLRELNCVLICTCTLWIFRFTSSSKFLFTCFVVQHGCHLHFLVIAKINIQTWITLDWSYSIIKLTASEELTQPPESIPSMLSQCELLFPQTVDDDLNVVDNSILQDKLSDEINTVQHQNTNAIYFSPLQFANNPVDVRTRTLPVFSKLDEICINVRGTPPWLMFSLESRKCRRIQFHSEDNTPLEDLHTSPLWFHSLLRLWESE